MSHTGQLDDKLMLMLKNIASLEESKQQIDFDESFFNENQGDFN